MPEYEVTCMSRDFKSPIYRVSEIGFNNNFYAADAVAEWLQRSKDNRLWIADKNGDRLEIATKIDPNSQAKYLVTLPGEMPLANFAHLSEC